MRNGDVRHLRRHMHQIIGHTAGQQLPLRIIDALLERRRSQTLPHAAADLLVHEMRIDHVPAILDDPVVEQTNPAAVDIDLRITRLHGVGDEIWLRARREVADNRESPHAAGRQQVPAVIGE